jgi:hypothetical protein
MPRQNHRPPLGRTPTPRQQRIRPRLHRPHPEFDNDLSSQSAIAVKTATLAQNFTNGTIPQILAIRQRFQQARTQVTTMSSDIRRFFPGRRNASQVYRSYNTMNTQTSGQSNQKLNVGRGVTPAAGPGRLFSVKRRGKT